jgi:hypothetical protein
MKSIVVSHLSLETSLISLTQIAKSLVMKPFSTVSITDLFDEMLEFFVVIEFGSVKKTSCPGENTGN